MPVLASEPLQIFVIRSNKNLDPCKIFIYEIMDRQKERQIMGMIVNFVLHHVKI